MKKRKDGVLMQDFLSKQGFIDRWPCVHQVYTVVKIGLGQNNGPWVFLVVGKSRGVTCECKSGMEFSFWTTATV